MLPSRAVGGVLGTVGGHYSVDQVERLARAGRVVSTKRVVQWLSNHGYDVRETLVDVLTSLPAHGRFIGSCVLGNGQTADEYQVILPADDWYLKFWIDEEQTVVDVWSCCWDGVAH